MIYERKNETITIGMIDYLVENEPVQLNDNILSEYNIILTFANKLLSENIQIDMEIQNIVDEYFWDML